VKKQKTREKFTQYYELLDAFKEDGCPICTKLQKGNRLYLDSLLYEHVNDPPLRTHLRSSMGFCHRHSQQAIELGDRFGLSIIYEDLLSGVLASSERDESPPNSTGMCPACVQEHVTEENVLQVTLNFLDEPEFQDGLRNAQPFCLNHSNKLIGLEKRKDRRAALLRSQCEKLRSLHHNLKEFIRKHDHRYQHEKIGEDEAISWRRAIQYFVGTS
jgi:hypothetical protein